MYRRISLRHNERSRRGGDRGREGISALRRARLSKKRFALLLGLFLLALFPNSGPPAVAAPRASGEIVAHEVSIPLPAVNSPLTRQGGGTVKGAAVGQTGGDTLLFSSPRGARGRARPHLRYVTPAERRRAPPPDGPAAELSASAGRPWPRASATTASC